MGQGGPGWVRVNHTPESPEAGLQSIVFLECYHLIDICPGQNSILKNTTGAPFACADMITPGQVHISSQWSSGGENAFWGRS
jgi:hypothetical protein